MLSLKFDFCEEFLTLLNFCEEQLFRIMNQADEVKNVQGIEHYNDLLYAINDLTK